MQNCWILVFGSLLKARISAKGLGLTALKIASLLAAFVSLALQTLPEC
jgi:hypothetical protein